MNTSPDHSHESLRVEVLALRPNAELPSTATPGSAGYDLRAAKSITIDPGHSAMIPTGLAFALPEGVELQVRPRSGLALRHSVTVLNTPGTVDSDYRGEVGVILVNHGRKPYRVEAGDRVAQAVFARYLSPSLALVDKLPPTERARGGFGSTGR